MDTPSSARIRSKLKLSNMLDMAEEILSGFGIQELEYKLATKPDKGIGSDEIWEEAIDDLKKALEEKKLDYEVEEGEGAFYGPKIDIHIKDALGRSGSALPSNWTSSCPKDSN